MRGTGLPHLHGAMSSCSTIRDSSTPPPRVRQKCSRRAYGVLTYSATRQQVAPSDSRTMGASDPPFPLRSWRMSRAAFPLPKRPPTARCPATTSLAHGSSRR